MMRFNEKKIIKESNVMKKKNRNRDQIAQPFLKLHRFYIKTI